MIDEEETFKQYGYHSYDLTPQSNKKVVAVCDDCGKIRILKKCRYHALCKACANRGKRNPCFGKKGSDASGWKGGPIMQICEECGIEFPKQLSAVKQGGGKFCTTKCYGEWASKHRRGENNPAWKNGASFEPYCVKFNDEFKEYIRDKFERLCFLCDKTEEENGERLCVHHVNGNKNCGCDGDETCQFVPLCKNCHGKMLSKKVDWEVKIKAKMQNKLNGWYI